MDRLSELADFYRRYGQDSFGRDEPAYASICNTIAERTDLLELIAAHPREAQQPNLVLAAVHYLILGGLDHPLRDIYYGKPSDAVGEVFADLVTRHRGEVEALLATRRTQTNEVGRCAVLALALGHARSVTDRPLAWIDVGTSGGLNLGIDHMRVNYRFDDHVESTGRADAMVVIDCELRRGRPVVAARVPDIAWRVGIDHAPVDVADPDQARWLLACLWPSMPERAQRLAAAIEIARTEPPEIIEADAVAGVATALRRAPVDAAIVVTTTWVWYYLKPEARAAVRRLLAEDSRPVLWFSLEGAGEVVELGEAHDPHSVDSTIGFVELSGRGDDRAEVLGHAHPHGTWIEWSSVDAKGLAAPSGGEPQARIG